MYIMKKYLVLVLCSFPILFSQEIIGGDGITGQPLMYHVILNYKSSSTLGYNNARDVMYSIIDLEDDDSLKGIYTNYTIFIDSNQDPRPQTNALNMNCEHSWPQSMGAGSEPQKSDLHHLYPARGNVNSSRGNKPFADIDDNDTDKWWRLDYYETSIPNQYIDEFSEVANNNGAFEPREEVKGNIARSMFYFFTMYNEVADTDFFNIQKEILYTWHKQDPVDANELNRTWAIAEYQENKPNPYILDSTLVRRIWFEEDYRPTWYISIDGSDDIGDGSEQNPFATIQKGVDSANDNDTIFVLTGTYLENINWSMANNIRLIGSHMDSTIIDGGGIGKVIDNSDETSHPIEISNLTIQNGYSTGRGGGLSLKMVGDILLKNIKVDNNQAQIGAGIYIEGEGSSSFIPTILHIENSVISNNNANTYGGGVSLSGAMISAIVKSVTIVNNSAIDGGGGINSGSMGDYAIIANSIFWNNLPTNADGLIFPYYSNIDIPTGTNNIYMDPLFVQGDTNFNLSDGSPCIDAGIDFLVINLSDQMLTGDVPDTLINFNSQPYNGIGPDMGAFESTFSSVETCIANDGTAGVELWGECYSIENTTTIQYYNTELNSPIPSSLGMLTNLQILKIDSCGLYGNIPPEIGDLINLSLLSISGNDLDGSIPLEIGNLINLTSLSLNHNNLSNEIPAELFNLENLSGGSYGPGGAGWNPGLDLSNNLLSGTIPDGLNSLDNIQSLNFSNNLLEGEILPQIINLINLRSIDLSGNQFQGNIPDGIINLVNLSGIYTGHMGSGQIYPAIDISDNQFSGIIPSDICSSFLPWNHPDVEFMISFSQNNFCSPYPYCIADIIGVQDITNCEPLAHNGPVWYVSTTGSDNTGDGSEQFSFSSIQNGINYSSDGDTVYVFSGTYIENINFHGKNIVVMGENRNTTVIDGNQAESVVEINNGEDSSAVLKGFTLTNGLAFESSIHASPFSGDGGGLSIKNSSNPTITDLIISGNEAGVGGGISIKSESDPIISDVIISNNYGFSGGGIFIQGSSNPIVNNATIVQNRSSNGGGGAQLESNSSVYILNSTIADNYPHSAINFMEACSVFIQNSIIWNEYSPQVTSPPDSTIEITFSNIKGGWLGEANINSDPLFCITDSSNYTLAENSPCIASGYNNLNMGSLPVGCDAVLAIDNDILPYKYILHQNFPNPFNPHTSIAYHLPIDGFVNIYIYDMNGRIVKTLVSAPQTAGFKAIQWNATNNRNEPVSAGLYLYTIQAREFRQTKKMVLLK